MSRDLDIRNYFELSEHNPQLQAEMLVIKHIGTGEEVFWHDLRMSPAAFKIQDDYFCIGNLRRRRFRRRLTIDISVDGNGIEFEPQAQTIYLLLRKKKSFTAVLNC